MNLSSTSIFVCMDKNNMAAILRDEETNKYFYQIIKSNITGMEKKEIIVEQCVGPFEDFVTVNNEIDKLKGIK